MRLLLLLSALLAALSGAGAGARAPQAQAVAVTAGAVVVPAARAHVHVLRAVRLVVAPAGSAALVMPSAVPLPAPRFWAQRRRE